MKKSKDSRKSFSYLPWKGIIRLAVSALIFLLAFAFIARYIYKSAKGSEYFKIKDVIARNAEAKVFLHLKGRNIFSVDLKSESGYILRSFPDCKKIDLVRLLPDKIFADFVKREPVAIVKLYRNFFIDEKGVLFLQDTRVDTAGLPVLIGLETKIFGAKSGRKYNVKEVSLALELLREIKKNKAFSRHKIKKIDLAKPSSASVMFILSGQKGNGIEEQGLEVKLGDENIKKKITDLSGIFAHAGTELLNMKYIDMRFIEPVIKLKANDKEKP